MNKNSRDFFNILNRFERNGEESKLDIIDISHISLEEITYKYEKYIEWYYQFLSTVGDEEKRQQSRVQKTRYDKMYRFWINPFHIALRNAIGKTGIPNQMVERVYTGKGDKAKLTDEAIEKIKSKFIKKTEKNIYQIDLENFKDEIKKIIKEIEERKNKNQNVSEKSIDDRELVISETEPIEVLDRYEYETGILNQLKSYITKYKVTLEENGIKHSKEIYADISLRRFYQDKAYQRVVLEAIENLELENYLEKTNNNYIGSFQSIIRDGVQIWNQGIRESDLEAIKKIQEKEKEFRNIALNNRKQIELGE